MSEVRTKKGKLIGMVDARTSILHIKDGKKTTMITIPNTGLMVCFASGISKPEEVYIPFPAKSQQ